MKHITVTHRVFTVYPSCNRDVYALVFVVWLVSLIKNQFDTSFQNEDWGLKYLCCEVLSVVGSSQSFLLSKPSLPRQAKQSTPSTTPHPPCPRLFHMDGFKMAVTVLYWWCKEKKRQLEAKSNSGGWVTARRAAEDREEGQRGWLVYQGS